MRRPPPLPKIATRAGPSFDRRRARNVHPTPMTANFVETAGRKALVIGGAAIVATVATIVLKVAGAGDIAVFLASAVALATLASLVGEATDQLGTRLGPGATGVVQSALGNLPELFIS